VQSLPQAMPAGVEVAVPLPAPVRVTDKVSSVLTDNKALARFSKLSVAMIVALPRATPTALPFALTVATVGLLLVQVRPVPLDRTGVDEVVVVPSASCP
jgi:hypothetical protein